MSLAANVTTAPAGRLAGQRRTRPNLRRLPDSPQPPAPTPSRSAFGLALRA